MREPFIKLNLQFFSAESEGRTEKATDKKRSDARKKGQVAQSKELNTAAMVMSFAIACTAFNAYMLTKFETIFNNTMIRISEIATNDYANNFLQALVRENIFKIILICLPIWAILILAAIIISYIQVKFKFTMEPMKFKMDKMNPLKGLKKIISKDMIINLGIALAKITMLGLIAFMVIKSNLYKIMLVYKVEPAAILQIVIKTILQLGYFVGGAFTIIAVADYVYQKYKFEDSIKMTKQEVKEEYKNMEGNPEIKGKRKQKMREIAMSRMMQEVPKADVVITNPTHFAVALTYDENSGRAPIVVAKGVDYIALQIKEKAKESGVSIMENKTLARTLYHTVDLDREIPPELYGAVAEVLAFIYNLRNSK